MKEKRMSRLGSTDEIYAQRGLKKRQVELWEDGLHSDGSTGSYEWWYFDSHLEDGSSLVIVFYTKNQIDTSADSFQPYATLELVTPDGQSYHERITASLNDFKAAKDRCDVQIGSSYFRGDLTHYEIFFNNDKVTARVQLDATIPSWRPETGYFLFGDNDEDYFAWLPSVPKGTVNVDMNINGKSTHQTGTGYHDHNWGNVPMIPLMNHWYWGRAKIGDYNVIASYITAEEVYEYNEFPVFMLVDSMGKLYDDTSKLTFTAKDVKFEDTTKKPYHNTLIYDYIDGDTRFRITFSRKETVIASSMMSYLQGAKRTAAEKSGFDGAYHRFTGDVTLQKFVKGEAVEKISDNALWELMYFGKSMAL